MWVSSVFDVVSSVLIVGTPPSEEDSVALQRLLQKAKVKLPPSQLTFERVQQLLLEEGHKDLAINLRAELDKG